MKSTNKVFKVMRKAAIVTIVAVIGFAMVSCGDGGGTSNSYKGYYEILDSYHSGSPTDVVLAEFGLNAGALDGIATGSGYKGWDRHSGMLQLVWINKTKANAASMAALVTDVLDDYADFSSEYVELPAFGLAWWEMSYKVGGTTYECDLWFYLSDMDLGYYTIPAGTIELEFN